MVKLEHAFAIFFFSSSRFPFLKMVFDQVFFFFFLVSFFGGVCGVSRRKDKKD